MNKLEEERNRLLELQQDKTRFFSQEEFDRLKELSEKLFKNAGNPHLTKGDSNFYDPLDFDYDEFEKVNK